jgi:hypothetical protein
MPVFDEDDERELQKILESQNVQGRSQSKPTKSTTVDSPVDKKAAPPIANPPGNIPPLVKPNTNWRTARSDMRPYTPTLLNPKKPEIRVIEEDEVELDYEDVEAAMRELEMGGFGLTFDKHSAEPEVVRDGLEPGSPLQLSDFSGLRTSNGSFIDMTTILGPNCDLLLVYANPRRLTEDFKVVVKKLSQVPAQTLGIASMAVSCDDPGKFRSIS